MSKTLDIDELISESEKSYSDPNYPQRILALKKRGWNTELIEHGIANTVRELESGTQSFVVYGEPQSGKTEFMIALACKLLDMHFQTIFVVMNDNVELETQNFDRFHITRELGVTPLRDHQLLAMPDDELKVKKQRIIFCRKNKKNLEKLIHLCRFMDKRIVIDDEADFATPNAKINKQELTAINEKLGELGDLRRQKISSEIDGSGYYIGVTATPARLDLNNTFFTDSRKWVFLDSHENYKGRSFFFPTTKEDILSSDFRLVRLPDQGDDAKWLRDAVFRFVSRVALLNMEVDSEMTAYSMLIHTAGKTQDHIKDQQDIQKIITVLTNKNHEEFKKYCGYLAKVIQGILEMHESQNTLTEVFSFILQNINRNEILVINHQNDSANVKRAAKPNSLFTFAIGGNIVSRGLTFERLLSFYFSRNVKGRLQQNTYIQRARMFGNRPYSEYFELCVPDQLYKDWAECFNDHEISLTLAKAGAYQHVQGRRTAVVDAGALDKKNVTIEKSERHVGEIFNLTTELEHAFLSHDESKPMSFFKIILDSGLLPEDALPRALLQYIDKVTNNNESRVMVVLSRGAIQRIGSYSDGDEETITRPRGGVIHAMLNKRPEYDSHDHFFLPIRNDFGQARILYKSNIGHSILQNLKINNRKEKIAN
ncbi:MAG: Z1 domain-containing protein [Methylophilaceae bacterium]|nr:Z1 domain-containing protein [Methylophilaceae bacterium]